MISDDIVIPSIGTFEELPLKAINKAGAVDELADADKKREKRPNR